uniref:WW domain-binding protein 11 n=1 Tax=Parastrongyloides trichosuri TaxID=131310 RepID=A0A0N4Z217_PARTI
MAKGFNPVEAERRRQKNRHHKKSKQLRVTQKQHNMTTKDYEGILKHMRQLDENEAKKKMPIKACEEKRKKLKQQYLEIIKFYRQSDNKPKIMELESKLRIYENERDFQMSVYLAEMTAENPSDIPLPPGPEISSSLLINFPSTSLGVTGNPCEEIPGPPPGPIPNLVEVNKKLRKIFRYDETGGSYQPGNNFTTDKGNYISGSSSQYVIEERNIEQKATTREFRKFDPSSNDNNATAQISSAPLKRDMLKEATKIVPAHLFVKRDNISQKTKSINISTGADFSITTSHQSKEGKKNRKDDEDNNSRKTENTDDAYELFMKQINNLI